MKYNRVILISIDALGREYGKYFEKYFTTNYTNYQTTSSWTLPSHLAMLSGKKKKIPQLNSTQEYKKYEKIVKDIPTISTYFRKKGFKTKAITGGGFMSSFFGWGHDWNSWTEASENLEWEGEKINPKKNEFFFLHTFYVHNWYMNDKKLEEEYMDFKKKLHNNEKIDLVKFKNHLKKGKKSYLKRVQKIAKKLSWIKDLDSDTLLILTSDHNELFIDDKSAYHGRNTEKLDEIYKVPFLIKEKNIKKRINQKIFDYNLFKIIKSKI
jgi:arylsulfatase A-like enzyme